MYVIGEMHQAISRIFSIYQDMIVYFYYTARPRHLNPLYYLREIYEMYSYCRLKKNKKLFEYISKMREVSESTGGGWGDYLQLYIELTSLRPKYILECGSGITSCVIAHAVKSILERGGSVREYISLEENYYYHEQVKKVFPVDLKPFVKFVHSERKERYYGNYLGCSIKLFLIILMILFL